MAAAAKLQAAVVAVLRAPLPEDVARWTPAAIARVSGENKADVVAAIQSLRFAGKIKFDRLELAPSMLLEHERHERLDDLGSVQDGRHKCPRTGRAGAPLVGATVTSPDTGVTARENAPSSQAKADDDAPVPEGGSTVESVSRLSGGRTPALPEQASPGAMLLGEIDAYCARVGLASNQFGRAALGYPGFVGLLRKRGTVTEETAARARAFMADRPDGVPYDRLDRVRQPVKPAARVAPTSKPDAPVAGGRVSLIEEVKAEALANAERRRAAHAGGQHSLSVGHALQLMLLEEVEDGLAALRRRWPDNLADLLDLARAEDVSPGVMFGRVIGAGLMAIAEDQREALS